MKPAMNAEEIIPVLARNAERESFSHSLEWEATEYIGERLPSAFIHLTQTLLIEPQRLPEEMKNVHEAFFTRMTDIFSLDRDLLTVVYDQAGFGGSFLGTTLSLPRLADVRYAHYLEHTPGYASELSEHLSRSDADRAYEELYWVAHYLCMVLHCSAHELYHMRQLFYSDKFIKETGRANEPGVFGRGSDHAKDLGERGAQASSIRFLRELEKHMPTEHATQQEYLLTKILRQALLRVIQFYEHELRHESQDMYKTQVFAPVRVGFMDVSCKRA